MEIDGSSMVASIDQMISGETTVTWGLGASAEALWALYYAGCLLSASYVLPVFCRAVAHIFDSREHSGA